MKESSKLLSITVSALGALAFSAQAKTNTAPVKGKVAPPAAAVLVDCKQNNDCAGKGGCGGAKNTCSGTNTCHGHVIKGKKTAEECKAMGGEVMASVESAKPKK